MCSVCYSAEWNNQKYPLADEKKAVYQWKGWPPPGNMWFGGKCYKVRIPEPEDIEKQMELEYEKQLQEMRLKEIRRGSALFMIGCIVAACGFAMHFMTAYKLAQKLSEWVLSGGLVMAGTGLVVKKAAEYQNFIVLGLIGAFAAFLLYKGKDWSISHLFKRKEKE
jgi:hypothetical protein